MFLSKKDWRFFVELIEVKQHFVEEVITIIELFYNDRGISANRKIGVFLFTFFISFLWLYFAIYESSIDNWVDS